MYVALLFAYVQQYTTQRDRAHPRPLGKKGQATGNSGEASVFTNMKNRAEPRSLPQIGRSLDLSRKSGEASISLEVSTISPCARIWDGVSHRLRRH